MNQLMWYIASYWVPLAITVTILSGLIYLAVQQDMRILANDPQIQMAEDIATALSRGQLIQPFDVAKKMDLSSTLSPYVLIYNEAGQPIAGTVQLDGQLPQIPNGIFGYVNQHGEDRLIW